MTQDSGCSKSTNDGTRVTGASLLNALALQPCIVREASVVWEPVFHLFKSAKVELRLGRRSGAGAGWPLRERGVYLAEVWRYPVKSMAGEMLSEATIGEMGVAGDRELYVV